MSVFQLTLEFDLWLDMFCRIVVRIGIFWLASYEWFLVRSHWGGHLRVDCSTKEDGEWRTRRSYGKSKRYYYSRLLLRISPACLTTEFMPSTAEVVA